MVFGLPSLATNFGDRRFRLAGTAVLAAILFALVWLLAGTTGQVSAIQDLERNARAALPLAVSALRSELDKQRAIPLVLSEDREIRELLSAKTPQGAEAVDRRLKRLVAGTQTTVLYLIDRDGLTIASSNFDEPTNFVGVDYRFRDYFREAMATGTGAQYALGTRTGRPGLYLSRRVEGPAGPLGVVVAKVELNGVEADWREAGNPIFVSDARGIVLATTRDDWRFRTLRPIPPGEATTIRRSLQFGDAPLAPMPLEADPLGNGLVHTTASEKPALFLEREQSVSDGDLDWRLHLLLPAREPIRAAVATKRWQWLSVAALAMAGFLVWMRRHARIAERQERLAHAAAELERRVGQRTSELTESNRLLQLEMAVRAQAEQRMEVMRDELQQANRLASLGQIAAGVAHEINQPVSAIRTFSENANAFLARDDRQGVRGNLDRVIGLTERIGTITGALRGFARRGSGARTPLLVGEAAEAALLLLRPRLESTGVEIVLSPALSELVVLGERVRLEQVFVNLFANALDALANRPAPCIRVDAELEGELACIRVTDNGCGMAPEFMEKLFTPFNTSKERGLGLGLVIVKDIVVDWGGDLAVSSGPDQGSTFTLHLPRAP